MKMITIPISINKGWGEIPDYKTLLEVDDEVVDYIKNLEKTIEKYNKELQELITELNGKIMLKDKQIKEALRIIDEKRGEYDIPSELENVLGGESE